MNSKKPLQISPQNDCHNHIMGAVTGDNI